VDYYRPLVEHATDLQGRLLWLAYEDVAAGTSIPDIERFLGARVQLDKIWANAELGFLPEWITDLYYKPPSTASVGKDKKPLSVDHARIVEVETGPIYTLLRKILGR
jgi:hypothetical protein